ncbi:MAG: hypothetical protein FWG11_04995 [Promicromonosporaceae bacterium]|jgi:fumarate reductase subunit D|nr:hypothetical protein [Promicromonosporaceae bacterium]
MRRRHRTNEPARWALFGAGGELAAVVLPALIIGLGITLPLGVLSSADRSYAGLAAVATHPLVAAGLCAILGLILWHCCHRAFHFLHDLQLHPPRLVMWAVYGFAVVVPLAAWVLIVT